MRISKHPIIISNSEIKQSVPLKSSIISNPTNFEHKIYARSIYEAQKLLQESAKESTKSNELGVASGKNLHALQSILVTVEKSVAAKI